VKKFIPWLLAIVLLGWAVAKMIPPKNQGGFDVSIFGRFPVLAGGRVMPLDSLARVSLLLMNHHGTAEAVSIGDAKTSSSPTAWLMEVLMMPEHADTNKVFEINNPDLLDAFGLQRAGNYSFSDLQPYFQQIEEQAGQASQVDPEARNAFQRSVLKLRDSLRLYLQLKNTIQPQDSPDFGQEIKVFQQIVEPGLEAIHARDEQKPFNNDDFQRILLFTQRYQNLASAKYAYAFPNLTGKTESDRWQHVSGAMLNVIATGGPSVPLSAYGEMISAYRAGDVPAFNQAAQKYADYLGTKLRHATRRPNLEFLFNQAQPFYQAIVLYLVVLLLGLFSWLVWPKTLGRTAVILLCGAFVLHTAGLVIRMYLQGRPPVTNLYSSAVFVGWGSVLLCLLLERFYRNGIGSVCGAGIGFGTLLIAQNLQFDGDTLEMLRAVLDTNVWLATHVVGEAMGYSAMFLAGFLGIIYIFRGLLTRHFAETTAKSLGRMIYGIVCFATLFSLVATILGGIWGDQSWGRFWGWDPKENGALMIVLWNAIILHARWGGFVRDRGIAVMAVFGNVVTSLSWFGVNMLGVGLHSYGFMDQAFGPLLAFIASQLVIIGLGMIPLKYWRGFKARPPQELPVAGYQLPVNS